MPTAWCSAGSRPWWPSGCAASTRRCTRRNLDCGDHIVVVNAEKVALTGNKRAQKTYYRHTGYPGGHQAAHRGADAGERAPERVIEKAVQRMLPKGALGRTAAQEAARLRRPRASAPGADAGRARRRRPQSQEQHQESSPMAEHPTRTLADLRGPRADRRARARDRAADAQDRRARAAPMRPGGARTRSRGSGSSRAPAGSPSTVATSRPTSRGRCCA